MIKRLWSWLTRRKPPQPIPRSLTAADARDFGEALELAHGQTLSGDDLSALVAFQDSVSTSIQPWVPQAGFFDGIFGKIFGFAIGIGLSFIPGLNFATALFIGAAIGGLLGIIFQKRRKEDPEFEQVSTIASSPQFTRIGDTVPLIFCDRPTNKYGGVRTSGNLLHSRVETVGNVQYLILLICLGLGELGAVDLDETLINDQPLSVYDPDDIQQEFYPGIQSQNKVSFISAFSQVQYPKDQAKFGLQVSPPVLSTGEPLGANNADYVWSFVNAFELSSGVISSASDGSAYATSGALIPDTEYGQIDFEIYTHAKQDAYFGLSQTESQTASDILFGWRAQRPVASSGTLTLEIVEDGIVVFTEPEPSGVTNRFGVRIRPTGIFYTKNDAVVYTSTKPRPTGDLHAHIVFGLNGGRFPSVTYREIDANGDLLDGQSVVKVSEEDYDAFSTGESYLTNGTVLRVVDKDPIKKTLTFSSALGESGKAVWRYEKFSYRTTKRVDQIGINIQFNLWARDKTGNLTRKGTAFDLYVKPATESTFTRLYRIFCQSNSTAGVVRAFEILDLPLGYYDIELRPVTQWSNLDLAHLGDSKTFRVVDADAAIGGVTPRIRYERGQGVDNQAARELHFQNEKGQNSNDSDVTATVTAVNEIVTPASIGLDNNALRYPGLAVVGVRMKGLDGGASFLVTQGLKIKNIIAAGEAAGVSGGDTLQQDGRSLLDRGAMVGDTVRNLRTGQEQPIQTINATTLTTASTLNWLIGDNYLIHRRRSSNYLPDIAAALADIDGSGVGRRLDADYQLHYPSYETAREFCEARNYYWDGVIREDTTWAAWVDDNAPTSLLIPIYANGQYQFVIERDGPVEAMFNAGNLRDVSVGTLPLRDRLLNTVQIEWSDGSDTRFNPRGTLCQTTAAAAGTEPLDQETLSFPFLTNVAQVEDVVTVWLNSRILQNLTVSGTTDATGLGSTPAQIVSFSHPVIHYQQELSGYIHEIDIYNPGIQRVRFKGNLDRLTDGFDTAPEYRGSIAYRDATGETIAVDSDLSCRFITGGLIEINGVTREPHVRDLFIIGWVAFEDVQFRLLELSSKLGEGKNEVTISGRKWTNKIFERTGLVIESEPYSEVI